MKPTVSPYLSKTFHHVKLSSLIPPRVRSPHQQVDTLRKRNLSGFVPKALQGGQSSFSFADDENLSGGATGTTKQKLKWAEATVVENRAASVDGRVRLLVLSVEDHVDYLEGMKLKRIQKAPRWIDDYKLPGQFVALRFLDNDSDKISPQRLVAIACSPYEARRNSALLDASLIEVLVERDGHPDNEQIASMSPGDLMQASEVIGRGFTSLFAGNVGLLSALEESRPLLLAGVGTRGMAPLRAVLNWAPVQAMAAMQPISFVYITEKQASAACIQDWDSWRDSGVRVDPVYVEDNGNSDLMESAIFDSPGGMGGLVGGKIDKCAVLLAGLKGSTASKLSRKLRDAGVSNERLLFCEF